MTNFLQEEQKRSKLRVLIYEYIERIAADSEYIMEAEDYVEDFITVLQTDWKRIKEVMESEN